MEEITPRMSDVVRFELPAYADVDEFCAHIESRWPGSKERKDDVWLVSARVRKANNDLALLLRRVEGYVGEAGLQAIRYQLDGRFYIMEAPAFDRATEGAGLTLALLGLETESLERRTLG
jgi:hypothetical protein